MICRFMHSKSQVFLTYSVSQSMKLHFVFHKVEHKFYNFPIWLCNAMENDASNKWILNLFQICNSKLYMINYKYCKVLISPFKYLLYRSTFTIFFALEAKNDTRDNYYPPPPSKINFHNKQIQTIYLDSTRLATNSLPRGNWPKLKHFLFNTMQVLYILAYWFSQNSNRKKHISLKISDLHSKK